MARLFSVQTIAALIGALACSTALAQSEEDVPPPAELASTAEATLSEDSVRLRFGPTTGLVVDAEPLDSHLELHFATWIRLELDRPPGGDAQLAFTVPLARPLLAASFFQNRVRMLFQPEIAGPAARLLDMQLELELDPAFVLRVGQYRTPFSRAFLTNIVLLSLPDRGFVDDEFRLDRDTGLQISGVLAGGVFEYTAGVFNGALVNGNLGDLPAPTAIVRAGVNLGDIPRVLPYDQLPQLAQNRDLYGAAIFVGAAYRRWRVPQDPTGVPEESGHFQSDLTMVAGPVNATTEGFLRFTRPDGAADWSLAWGSFVQLSVVLVPKWFEVAARAGWMDPNADVDGDFIQVYEAGLTFTPVIEDVALGHHLKAQLRYAFERADAPFETRILAGNRHRVTLQIQLWL